MKKVFSIRKRRTENSKFLGLHLAQSINSYLSLYTTAKEISKTDVVRGLLTSWVDATKKKERVSPLIEEIADKAIDKWRSSNPETRKTFSEFAIDLEAELTARGIEQAHILLIMARLTDYGTNKRKPNTSGADA